MKLRTYKITLLILATIAALISANAQPSGRDIMLRAEALMISNGGKNIASSLDDAAALRAVEVMQPIRIIPAHYNCSILFKR